MNTEVRCVRIKIKSGELERVREWATMINDRRVEALETLGDEGVTLESVFLENTPEGSFLIYYMRTNSFEMADQTTARSQRPIEGYHQEFKRVAWESHEELETLVDLVAE